MCGEDGISTKYRNSADHPLSRYISVNTTPINEIVLPRSNLPARIHPRHRTVLYLIVVIHNLTRFLSYYTAVLIVCITFSPLIVFVLSNITWCSAMYFIYRIGTIFISQQDTFAQEQRWVFRRLESMLSYIPGRKSVLLTKTCAIVTNMGTMPVLADYLWNTYHACIDRSLLWKQFWVLPNWRNCCEFSRLFIDIVIGKFVAWKFRICICYLW